MNQPGKPITNPMLVGTIELLKAEDSLDHRNMFVSEMMKAHFLAPVVVTPPPVPDGEGILKMAPNAQVQFPMLSTPDGKQFLMAFTDGKELKKWKEQDKQATFVLTFDDYAGMLLRKDKEGKMSPASGFVINPYGGNIVMTREVVAALLANKLKRSGYALRPRTEDAEQPAEQQNAEGAPAQDAEAGQAE